MSAPYAPNTGAGLYTESPFNSNLWIAVTDSSQLATLAECTGTPPTTANVFQVGCLMIQKNGVAPNTLFVNTGTSAAPTWVLDGVGTNYLTLVVYPSGTQVASVFSTNLPPINATIVGVSAATTVSGTATTLTFKSGGTTVATVATSGSLGQLIAGTGIAFATVLTSGSLTVSGTNATGSAVAFVYLTNP
jgi:hypothetical protein